MRRIGVLIVLAVAAPAGADTLALKDGRFVEGRPIEKTGAGYVIQYRHGSVTVPADMVVSFFKEGESGEFVPTNPQERAKFEKGLVPWQGRWVKKAARERLQKAVRKARALRVEQMKERRLWRSHATVESGRFIFKHTLPDETFEEFKNLFETYYKYFTRFWRIKPSAKFGKATINIYHDEEYYYQVSGARRGVVGWYMPHKRDLNFYYDRENHRFTIDVMFHEGNHMLTHMIDENMWYPWWVGEGMAEYFGASEWDPKKKTMEIGLLQSGRLAVLQEQVKEEKMLKLKTLLETPGMGAIGYSWAWSFCHFLLSTKKYEKSFKRFYLGIARDKSIKRVARFLKFRQIEGPEVRRAFMRYLKIKDLDALEKEWYDYIKRVLSLDRAKLDWGQAGYIMGLYGQDAKARKFLKRAIDEGSKEAYVHYGYAELKLRQNMPKTAEKYARKATGFDPLHARAWALRGQALRRRDQDEEGMRLLELAAEMDPENEQIWYQVERARQQARDEKEREGAKEGG